MNVRVLLVAAMMLTACALEPSRKSGGNGGNTESEDSTGAALNSLEAFKLTVYPLVRQQNCIGCHESLRAPFFADPNPEVAHSALLDGNKVDFIHPEQSRLVQRLIAESHNCWSDCAADGAAMLAAVEEWRTKMSSEEVNADLGFVSDALTLDDVIEKKSDGPPANTIIMEAESATVRAPMVKVNSATASQGQIIQTANRGVVRQANDNTAGLATYPFNISEAGSYLVWGLVSTASANDDSFFIRMDNGPNQVWTADLTAGAFKWDVAATAANGTPLRFNLTAGAHTLQIREREDGARLDIVAVTSDQTFDGQNLDGKPIKILRFDLGKLLNRDAIYLEIEAEVFDAFSYKLKNPTILIDDGALHVRNLRIAVNGKVDAQNATYSEVEQTVSAPAGILSAAAMVIPKVLGEADDKFSVVFEVLELK
jgi:hypothetical protein